MMFLGCDDLLQPDFVARVQARRTASTRGGRHHPGGRAGHRRARRADRPPDRPGQARRSAARPPAPSSAASSWPRACCAATGSTGPPWSSAPSGSAATPSATACPIIQDLALLIDMVAGRRDARRWTRVVLRLPPARGQRVVGQRCVDGNRFADERRYCREAAEQMAALGWPRAARAARLRAGRHGCTRSRCCPTAAPAARARSRAHVAAPRRRALTAEPAQPHRREGDGRKTSSVSRATRSQLNRRGLLQPGGSHAGRARAGWRRCAAHRRWTPGRAGRTRAPRRRRPPAAPGRSEASTGRPSAIASRTGRPKPSASVGKAMARARPRRSASSASSTQPRSSTQLTHAGLGDDRGEWVLAAAAGDHQAGADVLLDERQGADQPVPVLVRAALAAGEHEVLGGGAARRRRRGARRPAARRAAARAGSPRYFTISSADTSLSVITWAALAAPRFSIHITGRV